MLRRPIRLALGKMAARGGRERSAGEGGSGSNGARVDADLLLHPELLSQEFLLLTLEQVVRARTGKRGGGSFVNLYRELLRRAHLREEGAVAALFSFSATSLELPTNPEGTT